MNEMSEPNQNSAEKSAELFAPLQLLEQARALRKQNLPEESMLCAERGLEGLPSGSLRLELLFELGCSELAAGHWQQAHDHLEACLEQEHPPDALFHRLGRACQELGQPAAARDHYLQALDARVGHNAGKTWHQLGRVYEQLGDAPAAIAAYTEAIACFKSADRAWETGISAFQLGRLQLELETLNEAQNAFRLARQSLAEDAELRAEACYRLSEIAIQLGQLEEAETLIGEALSIQRHLKNTSRSGICLLKLCQVLMLQRKWKDVLSTVREAITTLEGSKEASALKLACELQAELLQLLGKHEEAKVWTEKAEKIVNS
ncbi:MAG: tetratricopeptide repeat protein [Candidatus Sericytochromatia bacterium]